MTRRMLASSIAMAMGLSSLVAAGTAHAIPSTLTVQGYLTNNAGVASDGNYTITVSLWNAETAGTRLFTQTITGVQVSGGLFDVALGNDVLYPGLGPDIFKNNNNVYVQVQLEAGPGVVANEAPLPRQALAVSPFAYASHYATSAASATTANTATTATTSNGLVCSTGCVSIAELDFDPATQAELDAALVNLVTTSGLNTTLADYAKKSDLSSYVTSNALTTALASYVTSNVLNTTLGGYVTSNALNTTLGGYITSNALTTTLNDYAKKTDLNGYVTSNSLNTTLSSYVTSNSLNTTLGNYVSTAGLATTLGSYVTSATLGTTLGSYATTAALSNYVTVTSLSATLADYAKKADLADYAKKTDLPTSVNNLAGGTITSNTTVSGELAATSLKQNGKAVCDESGNCGATLGSLGQCNNNQVATFVNGAWTCANAGGSPTQACTGPGQALQWSGTAWQCINVRDSGLSLGKANGYEARDDWGDVWDGVPRSARSWPAANQACTDAGGRLPTVTEVWRNRATYGTANISTQNDNYYHWTIAPSYRANYYMVVYFGNNTRSEAISTSNYPFRCIWKSQKPAGFTGNRCFGPPGSECKSKDSFYNIDTWSRAPQYFPAARKECELDGGFIATSDDYEKEIQNTAVFASNPDDGWPYWHWTTSGHYYSNGYNYIRIVRWTQTAEPWWSPTAGVANDAGPASTYMFRCVGKKDPTSGFLPGSPACKDGNCFTIPASAKTKNRLIADATDRPAATWNAAFKACQTIGATLPTAEEFNQLVAAGWANGSNNRFLWSGSVATWGWQTYRWPSVGSGLWNAHYEYAPAPVGEYRTGEYGSPASNTTNAYRCVWREAEAETFLSCAAGKVQMRDAATGAYSCVNSVTGDANGNQNPSNFPPFVDAWGNAFDLFERASATYPTAKANCEAIGARLPVATELYRLRYQQGVVGTELGQPGTATQNYIWTLNPDYRENYQIQLRLSDGGATAVASNGAATAPYRCVWPATRPAAFSGHACYGAPAAPCFETDRLRTDRFPRASVPQAAAAWECRFFGGRLPTVRDYAQLQIASLPNSVAAKYEWSREWSYWSDGGTYIFAPARGTNADRTLWAFNSNLAEHNWYGYSSYLQFRCVFSDVIE